MTNAGGKTNTTARRQWSTALLTANALAPPSNYWLGAGSMMAGGPANELAAHSAAGTAADHIAGVLRGERGRASTALAALTLAGQAELVRRAVAAGPAVDNALDTAIDTFRPGGPEPDGSTIGRALRLASPVPVAGEHIEVLRDVDYRAGADGADGNGHKLSSADIHRRTIPTAAAPWSPAPILLHVHGGMWMGSDKRYEALPLLHRMAARGWVCVSVNYRLCPKDPFPAQIVDVKRAIAWIRENAGAYGAGPSFLAVTGGSAGGHLAALAALTANAPEFQPGFESADTSVQAAVPQYGIYDVAAESGTDRAIKRRDKFLAPMVLRKDPRTDPDAFAAASPLHHAHADAPPFFVLHGTADTGVEVDESRYFVERLRGASRSTVAYAEVPGAQHAYDHLNSIRARRVVRGVDRFLGWARAQHG